MKIRIKRLKKNIINYKNKFMRKIKRIKKEVYYFIKEKDKLKKLKFWGKKLYHFLINKKSIGIILCALPFIIMDIATRNFANDIEFSTMDSITPKLFSIGYIILILGFIFNLSKKSSYYTYIGSFSLFFILFLVHNVYYDATNNFFSFSLLGLASEGSGYFLDVIKSCNFLVYLVALIILVIFIFSLRFFPVSKGFNKNRLIITCMIFLAFYLFARNSLGNENFELTWDTWRNPRNVYNNFNDSNKCMVLSGLYEYTIRDFYTIYLKPETKKSETESNFLEEVFSNDNDSNSKNKYTGIFKNKNVIFLQMEGIDNWLLTEEIMPNTYKLLKNSINFTNHYSFYNGGGSTFNSEFAVNVGYMTPFTYPINAYTLNKNDFPYSMANLLKVKDYSIKAFHMNSSEYYSRGINYSNFGYDQYFGLKDLDYYKDNSYQLDRELILNPTFYEEMFNNEGKFVNYIITYSNHLPFSSTKGVCRQLINLDYEDKLSEMTKIDKELFIESLNLNEEDCIKRQAKETDYMVKLLMDALKENGLYYDTIIVAYADHYLYTVSDEAILKENGKDIETNLINHTPFFIWKSGLKAEKVTKVTSQLNILPTVLNMLGVNYNEKWYVSQDVFSKKYQPITIFSDLSWYDGSVYVVDGLVKNNKKISVANLEKKNNLVEYLIKKNDLVLKYNYFKEIVN